LVQTFLTSLAIKWPFKFLARLISVAALPGQTEQMQHGLKKKEKHQRSVNLIISDM